MYSFTVKSKVFQILTYITQERPNTVSQKDEIPQGWMIPQYRTLKSKLPKYRLKKISISQYRKPPCPPQFRKDVPFSVFFAADDDMFCKETPDVVFLS